MVPQSHIPSVTIDDLEAFRVRHFVGHSQTFTTNDSSIITCDKERTSDDGLGYYCDGMKRTLTDQQIEIFRHSEIQKLLRGRRLKEEAQLQQTDGGSTEHGPGSISVAETTREHPQHDSREEFRNNDGESEYGGSGTVKSMALMESTSGSADPFHCADGVAKLQ